MVLAEAAAAVERWRALCDGRPGDAVAWFERALADTRGDGSSRTRAALLERRARGARALGDDMTAEGLLDEAIEVVADVADAALAARIRVSRAVVLAERGHHDHALRSLLEIEAELRRAGVESAHTGVHEAMHLWIGVTPTDGVLRLASAFTSSGRLLRARRPTPRIPARVRRA